MHSRFLPGLTGGGLSTASKRLRSKRHCPEIGQAKHGELDAVHPGPDADQDGRNDPQADRALPRGVLLACAGRFKTGQQRLRLLRLDLLRI
jgi:hypothetical protein